mgnify:CR=1 FL=1
MIRLERLTKIYSLNNDTDVNYMVACSKPL